MPGTGGAGPPRSAAACSSHPITAHAIGEVVGDLLERFGTGPDVALLIVSPGHAGALEDAARAVRDILRPTVVVGWAAYQVVSGDGRPPPAPPGRRSAVGLWAAATGPLRPVAWTDGSVPITGRATLLVGPPTAPLIPDVAPSGLVVARSDVAGAAVVLDGLPQAEGWVGVAWEEGPVRAASFEGHRTIGAVSVVTRAEGALIHALGGRPAMEVLDGIARDQVPAADIALINRTVHLEPATGGPPIAVRGRDRATGALAVDRPVAEGDAVVFCVRDNAEAAARAARHVAGAGGGLICDAGGEDRVPTMAEGTPDVLACSVARTSEVTSAAVQALTVGDPATLGP